VRRTLPPLLLLLAALVPSSPRAQVGRGPSTGSDTGLVVGVDVGGGTALGAGTQYTRSALLEAELSLGYDLPYGIRPEVALALGAVPRGHVALRPGVHVAFSEVPFYVRGALDWSTVRGTGEWRWLLAGAGGEIRLTGALGGFAEVDLGIPLARSAGLGVMVRTGIALRL
jgi:hypothetical protein